MRPPVAGDALWRDTEAECTQAYWEAEGWWRHRVVTGTVPHHELLGADSPDAMTRETMEVGEPA
jgi:hypothetical protein